MCCIQSLLLVYLLDNMMPGHVTGNLGIKIATIVVVWIQFWLFLIDVILQESFRYLHSNHGDALSNCEI